LPSMKQLQRMETHEGASCSHRVRGSFAAVPAIAAENTTGSMPPSPQSSGPGVKGDTGNKNGPAAKPADFSTTGTSSRSGTSTGCREFLRRKTQLALRAHATAPMAPPTRSPATQTPQSELKIKRPANTWGPFVCCAFSLQQVIPEPARYWSLAREAAICNAY
jgi:hypothetical protein